MNIKQFISSKASLLLILIGGTCLFGVNFILKSLLDDFDYGSVTLLVLNYIILSGFGLLGFESTFIRKCRYINKTLYFGREFMLYGFFAILITSLISLLYFSVQLQDEVTPTWYFLFVLTINVNILLYHLLRAMKEYTAAMLVLSSAKIFFLLGVSALMFVDSVSVSAVFFVFLFSCLFANVIGFYFLTKHKLRFCESDRNVKDDILLSVGFLFSGGVMIILAQGDKIVIQEHIGKAALGSYYFLSTLILFPYSILQQYISFKSLVEFKNNQSLIQISKIAFTKTMYGAFVGVMIVVFYQIVKPYLVGVGTFDGFNLFLLLNLIGVGVLKITYSYYSAYFGLKATYQNIIVLNVVSLLLFTICYLLLLKSGVDAVTTSFALVFAWLIRCLLVIFISHKKKSLKHR